MTISKLNLTIRKIVFICTFIFNLFQGIAQPPCSSSVPLGETCSDATLLCNVSGYCGTTSNYTADSWPELDAAFCGSIENNSFIKFVAGSTTISFDIWVTNSTTGSGIQAFIFGATGCSGAVTSYTCNFQITPSSGANNISASGLIPGNSYYMMIDGFGGDNCQYVIAANSGVQIGGTISTASTNICLGNSAVLNASGGNGTYDWSPSPDLNTLTGSVVTALPTSAGAHTYSMTSYSNNPLCPSSSVTNITLNVAAPPVPNAGFDDSICFGSTISLHGIASSPTNTILWQNITTGITPVPTVTFSPNFSNLNPIVTVNQPGWYSFTFRESNVGCGIKRDTVKVFVSKPIQTLSQISPSCFGQNDGSILVNNLEAVSYSFDNGTTWQLDSFANNYASGTYSVCSKNALGCQVCSTINVIEPSPIQLQVSNDTLICENGTATLIANGIGGNVFTYHWGQTADVLFTQLVSPTTSQYYTVQVENEFGCWSLKDSINVSISTPITGTITPSLAICPGYADTLFMTATGGKGSPYSIVWSSGQTANSNQHFIVENPINSTNYTVTITDGCESTPLIMQTEILVKALPVPSILVDQNEKCEPAFFVITNNTDPTMTEHLNWQISNGQTFIDMDQITTDTLPHGYYDVQLIVTSPDGCIDSVTWDDYLISKPKPIADFRFNPSIVKMFNTQVNFTNYTLNAVNYQWIIDQGNPSYSNLENPSTIFPDGLTGNYDVTLIAESDFGCLDTTKQTVIVYPEVLIYVPNSFTPDGDEFNQDWGVVIEGIDVYDFKLTVLNRWNEVVWESLDPEGRWDGTFLGNPVNDGIYIWIIYAKDKLNDGKYEFKGFVNVLK